MYQQAQAIIESDFPSAIAGSRGDTARTGRTAMLFPGQGAFFAGVLKDAIDRYPSIGNMLNAIETIAVSRFGRSLKAAMWDENNTAERLLKTDSALLQLAIYAASMAAFKILETEGVRSDVLVGHSFGEIAALCCAGVYTVEQGAHIVCDRVESLELAAPADGRMAYVTADTQQVRDLLQLVATSLPARTVRLTIAVENHRAQTIVSGPADEMDVLLQLCSARQLSANLLYSPYAFHHPALARASALFGERLARYPAGRPRHPVYSPILGRYYREDDRFGELLAQHFVQPVLFGKAVHDLHAQGVTAAVECGALGTLGKIVIRNLGPGNVKTFAMLEQNVPTASNLKKITDQLTKETPVNSRMSTNVVFPEFENFWNERSSYLMGQIKAEILDFLSAQKGSHVAPETHAAPAAAPAVVALVTPAAPVAPAAAPISRAQLFDELVKIYADAMEYPTDVFSEEVELEADLGIDSVKQTEIISRISSQYKLPPLPANFRSGDMKKMGQIVDFVFAQKS